MLFVGYVRKLTYVRMYVRTDCFPGKRELFNGKLLFLRKLERLMKTRAFLNDNTSFFPGIIT